MTFASSIQMNNTNVLCLAVPILIVIGGATATGKSGLALKLAERFAAVILSADSRQIYRDFNIGTAKPSWTEQQQVPHYLIDICDPAETLTLADYQQQAQQLIAKFHRNGEMGRWEDGECRKQQFIQNSKAANGVAQLKTQNLELRTQNTIPLLVGGTGLYIKSIVRGLLIPKVAPQPELRSQLQTWGQAACYALLQSVDPVAAEKIHANDQVRTLRALEVFYVTGKPISQQQGECPPQYPILQIGLDCVDAEALGQRIERRTQQMIEAGFVAEVESLCQKYGPDLPLLNTLGYAEMKQHLSGDISLSEAQELIVLHTRQFAKQQRTWFRADRSIEWFDADAPDLLEQVWNRIQNFGADLELGD